MSSNNKVETSRDKTFHVSLGVIKAGMHPRTVEVDLRVGALEVSRVTLALEDMDQMWNEAVPLVDDLQKMGFARGLAWIFLADALKFHAHIQAGVLIQMAKVREAGRL